MSPMRIAACALTEQSMRKLIATTALAVVMVGALAAGALQFGKAQAADNVPLIGAGYAGGANVVAIPIDDPAAKAIAGALFKPAGAGPFPVVVYMPQSLGLTSPKESPMQKLEMPLRRM
jgi:hypothetical protein